MNKNPLRISEDLSLPLDAATQTFAFIARKGAGKTYAAGKLTELLLEAGVQVVILDTVGNWYGLRLAATGKGKGFDVPVFGGLRGDLPLQATAGELVADIAVQTGRSLILDLSQFSLSDRKRFATAFGEKLWRNKKAESHPTPLMLVIEESQLIVPQFAKGDDARMVGVYEEIIRLGRNYGIGCTMISQRPQSVNKEVLNQTECLFVLQVNGAQERKALKEWITHQGMDVGLLDELPSLPVGTAYVWSPQWLGILKKVKIGKKVTLDASATPKVGDRTERRTPAPLDLAEITERMAATIEQAKQNDPGALRREITRLNGEVTKMRQEADKKATSMEMDPRDRELLRMAKQWIEGGFAARLECSRKTLEKTIQASQDFLVQVAEPLKKYADMQVDLHSRMEAPALRAHTPAAPVVRPPRSAPAIAASGEFKLSASQQRILDALAWFESIGNAHPTLVQIGAIAMIDASGGHFSNVVGPLSSNELVIRGYGRISLTESGRELARVPDRVATLADYHDMLRQRVKKAKSAGGKTVEILNAIIRRGGEEMHVSEIGQEVNIDPSGGHFANMIGPLGTLGLIVRAQGKVRPTEIIFPPGLS